VTMLARPCPGAPNRFAPRIAFSERVDVNTVDPRKSRECDTWTVLTMVKLLNAALCLLDFSIFRSSGRGIQFKTVTENPDAEMR
jgi:hypothetical protein